MRTRGRLRTPAWPALLLRRGKRHAHAARERLLKFRGGNGPRERGDGVREIERAKDAYEEKMRLSAACAVACLFLLVLRAPATSRVYYTG